MDLREFSRRLAQWRLRLAEFDFTIEYRPDRAHVTSDALSRPVTSNPLPQTLQDEIPVFDDLLFRVLPTPPSGLSTLVSGSSGYNVISVAARGPHVQTGIDLAPHFFPRLLPVLTDVHEFNDDC